MPLSEKAIANKRKYNHEYSRKTYKRVPLDITHEKYAEIVAAANRSGETINGYIKKAIDNRLYKSTENDS